MSQDIVEAEARDVTPQKDFDIDSFLEKRKEFITKVKAIMVEGKDFHVIQGRQSMAKGGAEKIASIFGWTATFEKDKDAIEAFNNTPGIICFVCNLQKDDGVIGQGRGAALLAKNNGDPNKTLKMAQKSAFIDAVIRASGLSDFFTQDLEDMNPKDIGGSHPSSQAAVNGQQRSIPATTARVIAPSVAQMKTISKIMDQKGYTRDELITHGFDMNNLTGGRDGEASKLIDWLIKAPSQLDENGQPIADVPFN